MEHSAQTREELTATLSSTRTHRVNAGTLVLGFFALCLALVIAAYAFTRPLEDFVEYWTAGHMLLAHNNPYSLPAVFQAEKTLGWAEPVPLMLVCPPWVLSLIAPLGLAKSYALAWMVWVAVMTIATGFSSRVLTDLYFRDVRIREITDTNWRRCLLAFTFYPVLLSLKFAQLSPLLLLGVAGFLNFESKRRPVLAGAFLSLTLIKPQLLILIWLALVLRSYQKRQWTTLAVAAGSISLLTAISLRLEPNAITHYWELVHGPYLALNPSGVTAAIRKLVEAKQTYWLQFVPPLGGLTWFAFYWRKHRNNWNWVECMPSLIAASVLATAYGWLFDETLLALPIIALAAKSARRHGHLPGNLVLLYTSLNVTLILLAMASSPWSFLPAPIVVAFLLYHEARSGNTLSMGVRYSYVGGRL
jgi:hypothetical protein